MDENYLNVAIYEPIEFDVIIVFAERADEDFGNFEPSDVETELRADNNAGMKRVL